jgi:nitrate reductase molybdenum cofactor assembly chaperone NarJ/NarW
MLTFKVLSALLAYPEPATQRALAEGREILAREHLIPARRRREVIAFVDQLADEDIWAAQERYVALFDRTRSLSLHLYEHVHGESRDRGQAMVQLAQVYALHGLELRPGELPDYLPLFLEFLSELPLGAARSYLGEAAPILAVLRERLDERQSPYGALFHALEAVAAVAVPSVTLAAVRATLSPDDDGPAALDRQWEEEAVRFLGAAPAQAQATCGG